MLFKYPESGCTASHIGKTLCTSCTSYKICTPNGEFPGHDCPSDQPYCVTTPVGSTCSAHEDVTINECNSKITSPMKCEFGSGYFPDWHSCNFYHYCGTWTGTGYLNSKVYICPENYYYNYTKNACLSNTVQKCTVMTCSKDTLFSPYADGNNRWYGYCDPTNKNITMFRCPPNFKMNFKTSMCEFLCPRKGKGNYCHRIDDRGYPADNIYYECTAPEDSWDHKLEVKTCPERAAFHLGLERCTDYSEAKQTHSNYEKYKSCNYINLI